MSGRVLRARGTERCRGVQGRALMSYNLGGKSSESRVRRHQGICFRNLCLKSPKASGTKLEGWGYL